MQPCAKKALQGRLLWHAKAAHRPCRASHERTPPPPRRVLASPSRLLRFFARASLTTTAAACPVGLRRLNPPCSPLAVARRCRLLRIGGGFSPRVDAGASSGASFERRVYERRVVGVDAGASSGAFFLRRVYERR